MKLTIKQFQELYYIAQTGDEDVDKSIKMVGVITGLTPTEVEKMKMHKFNKLCAYISKQFELLGKKFNETQPKKVVSVKGRKYRMHYDVARFPHNAGKYVEALTFGKDVINNLHFIMATMAEPIDWRGRPYKREHEDIANDMEHLSFEVAYHAAVFFYTLYTVSMKVTQPYLVAEAVKKGANKEQTEALMNSSLQILDGLSIPKWYQNLRVYLSARFGV